jgi:iron complex outermembrane receptor protein
MHKNARIAAAIAAACSLELLSAGARAQAPAGNEPKVESPDLETVTVTGSLIPTEPNAVAVPVIALDAKQLEQNGVVSNPLEILRKAIPSFAGRSNAGTSNANNDNQRTAGGSQLQLRNLPTLILINGRRVANSGVGGINGKNFVDVNQIPAAAIDHIEVLTDGASSIYGSDAIGGVVNFILKSKYDGLNFGGRYGFAHGDYKERSAYVTGGTNVGPVNFTATGSYSKTSPLFQSARSFTSPLYGKTSSIPGVVAVGTNNPGGILAPGINTPSATNPVGTAATANSVNQLIANGTYVATTPAAVANGFDVSQLQTLLLQQEQDSFVGSVQSKIFDGRAELFGDVLVAQSRSFTQWLPVPMPGLNVPAGAPYNPLTTKFAGVTFDDLDAPKQFFNNVKALRLTAGARGDIVHGWTWETGFVFSQSDLVQRQANLPYKPNISRAIAGGYDANGNAVAGGGYSKVLGGYSLTGPLILQPALDPFARGSAVNPAALANVYGTEFINARSALISVDLQVVGTLFELPAGKVSLAVGGSVRRESLSGRADPNGRVTDPVTGSVTGNAQQWLNGTYADPFDRHRDIDALFAETRIPITGENWALPGAHEFDITAAVRGEKYSDAGRSTVPKVGFRWQPFDRQFTLRGNYSKSFSAPSLYAEYGPTDTRQVGPGVLQGVFGANYSGLPFNGEDGNNPFLAPARSQSRSIGFVLQPDIAPGLTVAVDYSAITLNGFAGGIGFNNIIPSINTLGSASPYFNNLGVDNFVGQPGASQPFVSPGDLKTFLTNPGTGKGDPVQANRLFVVDQFRNLATLIEHSYTIDASYAIPTQTHGTFTVSTAGAIFTDFSFQDVPGHPYIQYAGATNNAGGSGGFGGTLPRYRFFTSLDWVYNNLDLSVSNTYVSSTVDTGVNGTSTPTIPVASYYTMDVRAAYDFPIKYIRDGSKLTAAIGVNNVADRMPPLAPRAFLDNNADISTFSPLGRLIYGTLSVTF